MHRAVARDTLSGRLLEIGAGNLNHLRYHSGVKAYDAVEPFRELWEDSPHLEYIRRMYADITEINEEAAYDCILSIAVLEHLIDLPFILASAALLLAERGSFRAGFPSEGGFAWGAAWRLTTGLKYRWDRGLDYAAIMRHEHVNTAAEILALLRYFYGSVEVRRFPIPMAHLSFYTAATARAPRLDRCRAFCQDRLGGRKRAESMSYE